MKSKLNLLVVVLFALALVSCKDEEEARKGDPDLTHDGQAWNIASIDYELINQSTGGSGGLGQMFKMGVKENVGTFYFKDGGVGSFEMMVEGINKEDVFSYTLDAEDLSIFEIEQSVGAQTNQNVVAFTGGVVSETERTLSGTIVKQDANGQFILTAEIVLKKK